MTNHQSKIEKLIAELAPNEVEFKELWEITAWDKRFNGIEKSKQPKVVNFKHVSAAALKSLMVKDGNIKLLSTGKFDGHTTKELAGENVNIGEVITIPSGGSANLKYYKGKFVDSGNILATAKDKNVHLKFVYYFLLTKNKKIENYFRGSGVKHPSMPEILAIKIPVPSLDIQQEIVNILDKFTSLEAELEAELEARKQQYEHYRAQLLTFNDSNEGGVRWMAMGELATIGTGSRNTNEAIVGGKYPFFVRSQKPLSIDEYQFDETAIITAGDGVGVGKVFHFVDGKYGLHQRAYRIHVTSGLLLPKFLFYFIQYDFPSYISQTSVHASVTSLRMPMFQKYSIPVPSINEQSRIISILDKFNSLVGDISIGLPAELAARRQQYEYYREKLLTFKEIKMA